MPPPAQLGDPPRRRGYLITASPGGDFAFYRPDGTPLPASPPPPEPDGSTGPTLVPIQV